MKNKILITCAVILSMSLTLTFAGCSKDKNNDETTTQKEVKTTIVTDSATGETKIYEVVTEKSGETATKENGAVITKEYTEPSKNEDKPINSKTTASSDDKTSKPNSTKEETTTKSTGGKPETTTKPQTTVKPETTTKNETTTKPTKPSTSAVHNPIEDDNLEWF